MDSDESPMKSLSSLEIHAIEMLECGLTETTVGLFNKFR